MKTFISLHISLYLIGCVTPPPPQVPSIQKNPEITSEEIREHIKFLASDAMKGRFPGTPESYEVMSYIATQWKAAGVKPAGDEGYRQYFDFVNRLTLDNDNTFSINDLRFTSQQDFIPLGFSANGTLSAGIVFVGYGLSIDDSVKWDDYQDVDVEGKWVLILRGGPDEDDPHSPFEPHLALRKKVLVARDHKVGGVLFVSQVTDEDDDELIRLRYDHSFSDAGILAIHITQSVASLLLQSTGKTLLNLQSEMNEAKSPQSIALNNTRVSAHVSLSKNTVQVANLVGLIPGSDPTLKEEYIVLGAHFDHLGLGGPGTNSMKPDTIAVHNGADDNASGVAGVIEVGQKLAAHQDQLKRSVLLMCFDAEEVGLLGSKHYVNNPYFDLKNVIAMFNLDMIGRMQEKKLIIGGIGTSPNFSRLSSELNRSHNLALKFSNEGYGPSDHASFYVNDIPVLFFFSGTHEDYHKPSDDWQKINAVGEKQIADFIYDVVVFLSQADEKPQFTEAGPKEAPASRRGFKVTLGVIPSYGSQVEGLEIDGTRKDGPADQAGMQKGDIIIAIDGKEIKNIYDYMYRLGDLKAGQTVMVTVKREEEILNLTLEL